MPSDSKSNPDRTCLTISTIPAAMGPALLPLNPPEPITAKSGTLKRRRPKDQTTNPEAGRRGRDS